MRGARMGGRMKQDGASGGAGDRLTLLGVKGGPAVRQGGAMPTASLLRMGGETILVDCGIGATRGVVEAGASLLDLDAIVVTHLHSDHVLELGPLLYTAWTTGLGRTIPVYGPPGIEAYWCGFLLAMDFDHRIRIEDEGRPDIGGLVTFGRLGDDAAFSIGDVSVRALRVEHPPVTDCFALRFDRAGRSVVFSSDTRYLPALAVFACGADMLVHEAMLPAGVDRLIERTPGASRLRAHLEASHTTAEEAGRIASEAGVGTLVLHHLIPADDPEFGEEDWRRAVAPRWDGPLVVGRDGLTVPIGNPRAER
jgi:ribonuclease BN (tRNA processing enzyme)